MLNEQIIIRPINFANIHKSLLQILYKYFERIPLLCIFFGENWNGYNGGCKVAINIEFEMKFRIICQLGKHLKLFSHFSPRFRFVSLCLAGMHKYNRVVENLCLRQDNTQIMQISVGNASIFSITYTCIWYLIIFTGAAGQIHSHTHIHTYKYVARAELNICGAPTYRADVCVCTLHVYLYMCTWV